MRNVQTCRKFSAANQPLFHLNLFSCESRSELSHKICNQFCGSAAPSICNHSYTIHLTNVQDNFFLSELCKQPSCAAFLHENLTFGDNQKPINLIFFQTWMAVHMSSHSSQGGTQSGHKRPVDIEPTVWANH